MINKIAITAAITLSSTASALCPIGTVLNGYTGQCTPQQTAYGQSNADIIRQMQIQERQRQFERQKDQWQQQQQQYQQQRSQRLQQRNGQQQQQRLDGSQWRF